MQIHKHNKVVTRVTGLAVLALVIQAVTPLFMAPAEAATLTNTYLRLNRMKAATATSFRVVFKTSATNGTEDKLNVKFVHTNSPTQTDPNNRFTINTTQTVSSASCAAETGATALPGTLAATGDDTDGIKLVQITGVSDLTVSTTYCVDLTAVAAVTNPVNANQYLATISTLTSADATIDTIDIGTRIIADDQIVVSGVVPPSFNLVLSGYTDAFTTLLDPSAVVSTAGRTATITTNASKGWIAWVRDSAQGLNSATAPYTIPTSSDGPMGTPSNLTPGAEGYVLDVDLTTDAPSGGTVTVAPEYNGTTATEGGELSGTFQPIATADGTANGDVITLIERASISTATPAGNDYTDTLTVVAAGHF